MDKLFRQVVLGLWVALVASFPLQAQEGVATVTLLAGKAERLVREGEKQPLAEGQKLQEGDRVRVAPQSLVILRFSDGLRLSLRPESELLIQRYRAEGEQQLELRQGSIRIVTGAGARAHPERFRLATPIAAIGVRGTDFSARLDADRLYAQLHSGAIVIAPNRICAEALHDCAAQRLIEMPGDIWVIDASGRLAPMTGVHNEATKGSVSRPAPTVSAGGEEVAVREKVADMLPKPAKEPGSLVWGYWGFLSGPPLPEDKLSLSQEQAQQGRTLLLGYGAYGLWRLGSDLIYPKLTGTFTYQLIGSAVGYAQGELRPIEPAGITNPSLTADLSRGEIRARYTLIEPGGRLHPFAVELELRPNGTVITADQGITASGGLSADAGQAALRFLHPVDTGWFEGITLWQQR